MIHAVITNKLTVNQLVVGSIPTAGAKDFKGLEVCAAKPFFFANRPGNQKPAQRLQISAPPDDPGERRCDVPHLKRSRPNLALSIAVLPSGQGNNLASDPPPAGRLT